MAVKSKVKTAYYEIISALVITFSVVPGFENIGKLFLQVFLTSGIVIAFLSIADRNKIKPETTSHSLIVMTVYWIIRALIKQIKLHNLNGDRTLKWRHIFYYDRPAMLLVVFMTAIAFYAFLYIKYYDNEEYVRDYKKFQKIAFPSFLIFYFFILIYCFFLVRNQSAERQAINFIPFDFFRLMKNADYEYELIFLLFGNIAIFFPLGLLLSVLLKGKYKAFLIAFPFIISIGIETIQYFFRLGMPDIDDVIFNVFGFFLGVLVKYLFDTAMKKVSKGKINSVFTF